MKVLALTVLCSTVSFLIVANAYAEKKQFYPTVIYLLNSNRSLSIIYVQAFIMLWYFCRVLKAIFFGTLRAAEVEHLVESSWYAILETFILLAAFHQELSIGFVSMVTVLFISKSFHWLAADRVDFMERSPVITWLFHVRAISLFFVLLVMDYLFVHYSWHTLHSKGPSVSIVFGLEYAIMFLSALSSALHYILHTIDRQNDDPWENKTIYIRMIDIVVGFFKLALYVGYMAFMLYVLFIPLHIARRVYVTAKNFQKSIHDILASQQAIRHLNTLYPDATIEELEAVNNVCIICREEMVSRCKKLPCNHIFHTACLQSWFQRQQTCPTCRMDILSMSLGHQQHRGAGVGGAAAQGAQRQPGARQQQQPQNFFLQPPNNAGFAPPPMMFPPPMPWFPHMMHQQMRQQQQQQQQQQQPQDQPPADVPDSTTRLTQQQQQQQNAQTAAQLRPDASSGTTPTGVPNVATAAAGGGGAGGGGGGSAQDVPSFPNGAPPHPSVFPPFMFPPPPMAGGGFVPTGPISGDALKELSTEQLRQLEGMERANVEARLTVLRDVQKLLDGAVLRLNQYTAVMATISPSAGPGYPGFPFPPQAPFMPQGNQNTGSSNPPPTQQTRTSTHQVPENVSAFFSPPPLNSGASAAENGSSASATLPPTSKERPTSDQEEVRDQLDEFQSVGELRQRRLERFNSSPVSPSTSTSSKPRTDQGDDEQPQGN